jgi:hypothetical protein
MSKNIFEEKKSEEVWSQQPTKTMPSSLMQ